jgi:signal transduction histidine kinase
MDATNDEERLAAFAHDIRQCLHVMRTGISLLKEKRDDATLLKVCDALEKEEHKASALVEELLAFVRGQK